MYNYIYICVPVESFTLNIVSCAFRAPCAQGICACLCALRCSGVLSPLEFSGLAAGDCCMRNSREIWGPNLPIGPGKSEVMPIWAIWKSQKADMGDMADMDLVTATENESRYEMPIWQTWLKTRSRYEMPI